MMLPGGLSHFVCVFLGAGDKWCDICDNESVTMASTHSLPFSTRWTTGASVHRCPQTIKALLNRSHNYCLPRSGYMFVTPWKWGMDCVWIVCGNSRKKEQNASRAWSLITIQIKEALQSQDGGQENGKNIKNTPRNGMQPISGASGGKLLYCFLFPVLWCELCVALPCPHPLFHHARPLRFFWAFAWLPLAGFREKWKLCQEVNWLFRFKAFFNLYSVFVVNTNTFSFVSPTAATMPSVLFPALFAVSSLTQRHSSEMTSCGTKL